MEFRLEVPNETGELVKGLIKFLGSVKEALADGWQPGMDVPAIMMAAMSDLPAAVEGWDKLDDEAKQDPAAMIAAVGILASEIYATMASK